jgi:alpha-ketoglutarate-dependent 2,4-dichlorophenoxyacetate dioxygenase
MDPKIYDIDFNKMSDNDIKDFGRNIARDNVVLVRNQTLDEEGILRVCENIGKVLKPNQFFMHPKHPGLFRVTNERKDGEKIGIFADKELDWHSNGNGRPSGKECCVALYCVRPGVDSVTSFCDTRQAYQDLPEEIKEIVDDVDCTFQFKNNTFYQLDQDDKELVMFENKRIYPEGVTKPLVYTHPFDGQKGLYFTFHYIRNMWRRNGEELDQEWLKDYLLTHIFNEKYIYHHNNWKSGDFIFMDQFHSIHKRNEVNGDRFLYRISFDYRKCWNE